MKLFLSVALLPLCIFKLSAQAPLNRDVMALFDKIPPPPASAAVSFAKIGVTTGNDITCNAEKLFLPIEQEIKTIEREYESQARPSMATTAPGTSPEQVKKMSDPDMKKKMKSMTKEERMAMAMEMMKSAPAGTPAADPPPVRAALDAWQIIYNDTQNEFQRSVAVQKEEQEIDEQYRKGHDEIAQWEEGEIRKLPRISSGEMDAPDPTKVNDVKRKGADKHRALAEKQLASARSRWEASVKHVQDRYSAFYKKLIAADYASASQNFSTKKILSDAQMTILKEVSHHVQTSRKAWETSAHWEAHRAMIDKKD